MAAVGLGGDKLGGPGVAFKLFNTGEATLVGSEIITNIRNRISSILDQII